MKNTTKLLALCGILPVLADFIEDLNDNKIFTKQVKMKANHLHEEIRKIDAKIMQTDDIRIHAQQVQIGNEFRNWLKSIENN